MMRKALGYTVIFTLGFAVCLLMLRAYSGFASASDPAARRAVLALLDKPVSGPPIADNALVRAAGRIEPAVVNIDTLVQRSTRMYDWFGNPTERSYALEGKGSGVIISPDGFIVTNNHVIEGAKIIKVTLPSGKQFDGRVIGADPAADIAVVKIDGSSLPSAELGDSSKLKVGEYVIAIGYPLGIGTTVTHGIISATDRHDLEISEGRMLKQALQTDAPINRGNSGGALADLNGQLIGINTAIASENQGGSIGIGFAIPINSAREIIKRIIATGKNEAPEAAGAPFLGIKYQPLNPDRASEMNLPRGQGVVIVEVVPLTPAAAAGLNRDDIILEVDGKTVISADDIRNAVSAHKVGDALTLSVVHMDGSRAKVKITLGRKPDVQL